MQIYKYFNFFTQATINKLSNSYNRFKFNLLKKDKRLIFKQIKIILFIKIRVIQIILIPA